jgi:hypothetical protein
MPTRVAPAEQLPLFAEVAPATGRPKHGPQGLLEELIRQGLDPDALQAAVRLVAELDRAKAQK